jgi:hypothetical protein
MYFNRSEVFLRPQSDNTSTMYLGTSNNTWNNLNLVANRVEITGSSNISGSLTVTDNVGINTTNPQERLHVQGIARFGNAASNYLLIDGSVDGSNHVKLSNRFNSFIIATNTGAGDPDIVFSPASGGNVGIGINSPAYTLDVVSPSSGTIRLRSTSTAATQLRFENTGTGFLSALVTDNSGILRLDATGIKLNAPTTASIISASSGITGSDVYINDWGSVSASLASITANDLDGSGTANYVPKWSDSDTLTDSVIYDDGTNVGIGTTTPAHILSVQVPSNNLYAYYAANAAGSNRGGIYIDSSGNTEFKARTGAGDQVSIKADGNSFFNGGNVGIGTTSPSYKLDVSGSGNFTDNLTVTGSGGNTFQTYHDSTNNGSGIKLTRTTDGFEGRIYFNSTYNFPDNSGAFRFGSSNSQKFSGNSAAIEQRNSSPTFTWISNTNSGKGFYLQAPASDDSLQIYLHDNYNQQNVRKVLSFSNDSNFTIHKSGSSDSLLYVSQSGNVGIGTTTPVRALDIDGYIRLRNQRGILFANIDGNEGRVKIIGDEAGDFIQLNVDNSSSHLVRLNTSGFGIGTTSPTEKLTVEGNISGSGTLTVGGQYIYGDTTTPFIRLSNSAGAELAYGTSKVSIGGPTTIIDSGTDVMRFRNNKVVSTKPLIIGTTDINATPAAELHVIGDISGSGDLYIGINGNLRGGQSGGINIYPNQSSGNGRIQVGQSDTVFYAVPRPAVDNNTNLGSPSKRWATLYTTNLDVSGSTSLSGSLNVGGDIQVNDTITTPNNTSLRLEPSGSSGWVFFGSPTDGTKLYHYSRGDNGQNTIFDFDGGYYVINTDSTYGFKLADSTRVEGDLTVTGTVTAQEFHTEFVSASIIFDSGSTKFGDSIDDQHNFTGSLNISGSIYVEDDGGVSRLALESYDSNEIALRTSRWYASDNNLVVTSLSGQLALQNSSLAPILSGNGRLELHGNNGNYTPSIKLTSGNGGSSLRTLGTYITTQISRDYTYASGSNNFTIRSLDISDNLEFTGSATYQGIYINPSDNVLEGGLTVEALRATTGSVIIEDGDVLITGSLNVNGDSTTTGQLFLQNGTVSDPALTFTSDTNTGIYREAENELGISAGGIKHVFTGATYEFGTAGPYMRRSGFTASTPMYSFGSYNTTGMFRPLGLNAVAFSITSTEKLRIDSTGVGIGTSSPAYLLDVSGSGNFAGNLLVTGSLTASGLIYPTSDGTVGQAIVTDGNGNLSFDTISGGGGAINGTGSANYITRWDGLYSITSSSLYEGTSGFIGVGTTTPQFKLSVAGTVGIDNYIYHRGDTDTYFGFVANNSFIVSANGDRKITAGDNSVVINELQADSNFIVRTSNDSSTLFIDGGTDRVGIGTNSPTEKFHVSGSGMLLESPSYSDSGFTITDDIYDSRFGTSPPTNNSNYFWLGRNASSTYLKQSSGNWIFETNNSELVRITSDGKVGIGVTSPSSKLHVSSSTGFGIDTERGIQDGSRSGWAHYYSAGNAHILGRDLIIEGGIRFTPSSPDGTTSSYRLSVNSSNVLNVAEAVGGATQNSNIFTISGSNVGIGTASPSVDLDINGTAQVNNELRFTNSEMRIFRSSNDLRFRTANNDRMTIDSSGNVGIGITTPSGSLHIKGDYPSIHLTDVSSSDLVRKISIDVQGELTTFNSYNSSYGSHLELFELNNNTGNPTFENASYLYLPKSTAKTVYANRWRTGDNNTNFVIQDTQQSVNVFEIQKGVLSSVGTIVYVKNDGKVGIRNTSPSYNLDVSGSGNFTDGLTVTGSILHNGDLTVTGTVTAEEFHTEFISASIIYRSGSTKFGDTLDDIHSFTGSLQVSGSTGEVIIGSEANSAIYAYRSGTRSVITVDADAGRSSTLNIEQGGVPQYYVGMPIQDVGSLGSRFAISYQGSPNFVISGNSGIGINKVAPKYDLDVSGSGNFTNNLNVTGSFYLTDGTNNQNLRIYQPQASHFRFVSSAIGTFLDAGPGNILSTAGQNLQSLTRGAYFDATLSSANPLKVGDSGLFVESGSYNVGIGTTSPSYNLDVAGTANISSSLYVTGSVGIGTTSPIAPLHVYGEGEMIMIGDDTSGTDAYLSLNNRGMIGFDASQGMLWQAAITRPFNIAHGVGFGTSLQSRIYIDLSGNVGIGTTLPSYKLDVAGDLRVLSSSINYQENTDVDTGTETVATVNTGSFDGAFFDYLIKSGSNLRAGTVTAIHDGTNVEYNEVSTQDLGSTTAVELSVDISGADMRLRATTTSDNWLIKSLVRTL